MCLIKSVKNLSVNLDEIVKRRLFVRVTIISVIKVVKDVVKFSRKLACSHSDKCLEIELVSGSECSDSRE